MKVTTLRYSDDETYEEAMALLLNNGWKPISSGYGTGMDTRLNTPGAYWWAVLTREEK